MNKFVRLSAEERRLYFVQTAERMGFSPQIVEKDFWGQVLSCHFTCWTRLTILLTVA